MPNNCKPISVEDVVKFFEEDIDGMGKHGSHPRNQAIPSSIREFEYWEFGDLTKDEFMQLIIPDGSRTLIKDKDDLGGFTKKNVEERVKLLLSGRDLDPLIVTVPLPGEGPAEASFYIKDGAKRAIAYKIYFGIKPYKTVKAYIGKRKV